MNRFLRISLFSLMAMLSCGLHAQTATFTFTGEEAYGMTLLSGNVQEYNPDPYVCNEGDVTLTMTGKSRWWSGSPNHLRTYSEATLTLSVPEGYAITSIVFDSPNNTAKNLSTTVGSYETSGTWTGNAQSIDFACSATSRFNTIEVTYQVSAGPTKSDPGLAFSETEVSAVVGEAFTAPTLTKVTTADVTYSSDNTEVATVDETTGEVTIVAAGTAKITAYAAENDEYNAGSTSYTITATNPVLTEVTLPYSESFELGQGSFVIDNVNIGDLSYVWSHDDKYGYMKASAYANKKNNETESWLVSPTIDMAGVNEVTLTFDQCINKYFGTVEDEATLWILDESGEWKQIVLTSYPTVPEDGNWSDFETQTIDLSAYAGQKVKVAFKYTSTSEAAGTWEIRNFNVSGITTAIEKVEAETTNVNAPVYNLAGQRVENTYKGIVIKNGKKYINK